jgi:hypothetical protein
MDSGGIDPYFLNLGTSWSEWSASHSRRFTPWGMRSRYLLDTRLGGLQSRSGRRGENSWPYRDSNSDPSEVQSVASRYTDYSIPGKVKVKLSPFRPWRSLGLWEVEAPTFTDIRLVDGGKVVSPTRRPLFTPRTFPGTHFC